MIDMGSLVDIVEAYLGIKVRIHVCQFPPQRLRDGHERSETLNELRFHHYSLEVQSNRSNTRVLRLLRGRFVNFKETDEELSSVYSSVSECFLDDSRFLRLYFVARGGGVVG